MAAFFKFFVGKLTAIVKDEIPINQPKIDVSVSIFCATFIPLLQNSGAFERESVLYPDELEAIIMLHGRERDFYFGEEWKRLIINDRSKQPLLIAHAYSIFDVIVQLSVFLARKLGQLSRY